MVQNNVEADPHLREVKRALEEAIARGMRTTSF
jgi:hypothetical protein